MIEKIRYFLKEGLRGIWVNHMMSLASIIVLCICLIMLGTSLLSSLNINNFISQLESKNQIMVYLENNATDAEIASVGKSISALPNVKESVFFTKQEIFEQAKKTLGEQNVLLNGIDSSAFDCAYQVKISDISKFSQTVTALEKISGVKYVRQDQGLANILTRIKKVVSMAGFWLFVILAVISLFIISNTIKLAMFNRKREINIMKFVGATDWFIRWPFIIEGLIIGLISGGIALIAQYFIYINAISSIISMLNLKPISYSSSAFIIIPGFLIGGVAVGILGSVVSVRKYLKV
jgi:cell division transport system permease protein